MSQDELCCVCGRVAIPYSLCPQCKKVKQWLCKICGTTKEQIHDQCLGIKSAIFETAKEEIIHFNNIKKSKKNFFRKKYNR